MKYFFKALQNYATFDGRATRSEFWGFMVLRMLVLFVSAGIGWQILFQVYSVSSTSYDQDRRLRDEWQKDFEQKTKGLAYGSEEYTKLKDELSQKEEELAAKRRNESRNSQEKIIGLGVLATLLELSLLLPWLAVSVRRLHDIGKSAWFLLVNLIPITGSITFLVFMLTPGTRGENEYGPDPQRSE